LEEKECKVCGRKLPARREYFFEQNRRGRKGFRLPCRECQGYKFLPIEREGYQHCKKCETEYPLTEEFFSKSDTTFTGFYRSCKKCQNASSKEWRSNNPEWLREYEKNRWIDNPNGLKVKNKKYYDEHQEERIVASAAWYDENREEVNTKRREKRALNPEKYRENDKKYHLASRDKRNAYNKKRYWENPEASRESGKKYREENYDVLIAKRRGRRLNLTDEEREKVRAYQRKTQPRHNMQTAEYRSRKKNLTTTLTREDWIQCKEYFNQCAYCGKELKSFAKEHVIPVSKGGPLVRTNIVPSCKSCNSSKINNDMEPWYKSQPFFTTERLAKIHAWIGFDSKTNTQQLALY